MQLRIHDAVVGIDHPERLRPPDRAGFNAQPIGVCTSCLDLDNDGRSAAGLHPDGPGDVVNFHPLALDAKCA